MSNFHIPWLDDDEDYPFMPVEMANKYGVLCAGGNLSPGMLLSAYRRGIFPWYEEGEPILWWSPDPRFALSPKKVHISDSSRKLLRRAPWDLSIDKDFPAVISACARSRRPGQDGTWIGPDMIAAYTALHRLGYAHSVEAWHGDTLAGGLYGVSLGKAFFGESMFSAESGASRYAFLCLAMRLADEGFSLIDCQVYTEYLAGMGAREMPRSEYLFHLSKAIAEPVNTGFFEALSLNSLNTAFSGRT